jgi:hypothetical protein
MVVWIKYQNLGVNMSFANSREIFRGGQNHLFKKIGKIHQYSYFGTMYSKRKRRPRSIKGIIIRQAQAIIIYFYKIFQKFSFCRGFKVNFKAKLETICD